MNNSPPADTLPRRGSLLVIFLTIFIDLLGFGMVIPLLPIYADQFTADKSGMTLGLLMASFSIMQFLVSPLWGRISDRVGRRPILMMGLFASVLFYTLFGVATIMKSMTLLFVSRIGAGIAGATISTAQAYIADTTTLEQRPKGMAIIGVAFGMGFTFGPLLGFLAVPHEHADPGPWPGYVAAGLSFIAFMLAVFLLPESRRPDSESAVHRGLSLNAWRTALSAPSVGMILVAMFVCMFSLANLENTLSLLIKGSKHAMQPLFDFTWGQVCLTYAFIGLTLSLVQGGLVRRLADRVSEGTMALIGAVLEISGFALMIVAVKTVSVPILFVALFAVVSGYAFIQPNLQSLLSRRGDPKNQGLILGVGQSVSSFARIVGAYLGIPLLLRGPNVPYMTSAGLMTLSLFVIIIAVRSGKDYERDL